MKSPLGMLFVLTALTGAHGLAQTALKVNSPTVLLVSSEAKSVTVEASKEGPVAYTVADKPAWLNTSSAHNYTTPDTLYFQLASSRCGTCSATLTLHPTGGGEPVSVTVTFHPDDVPVQTQFALNPSSVNLNNSEARSISVTAFKNARLEYSVAKLPPWLTVTSANHYTTPDTLSFQIASSNCG
ncbi:MAG TPA: hypothetical protein VGH38_18260, partial [Bryobacteraceae bacterium]